MKTAVAASIILVAALVSHAWGDLTGRWSCNDGGTYYVRQTGSRVNWYGESAPNQPAWSNVYSGRIRNSHIRGDWTDVPKGRTKGSGALDLVIEKDGTRLRAVKKSGGFGGSRWVRLATETAATRPLKPLIPSKDEDCVGFNPVTARVSQTNGSWKIVDRDHWLFDFRSNRVAANKALAVIRHYRLDRSCFVGLPDPSFCYMLARGGSPSGAMANEDCVTFDPQRITASKIQNRWKIVSGRHGLFDFGKNEAEARQALAVIRRHGFTHSCFVGRPASDFNYLRR